MTHSIFCSDDQGSPPSLPSKSLCHYLLQVFVLLNHRLEVCCLSPQLTCIHAHTSSKIVLVNEIRLNHALAFHQSLCDGCSPLIHGSQPLQLLPVCSDMSNGLLYLTPCWAVDLPEGQAQRDRDHLQPLAITSTQKHISHGSIFVPRCRHSKTLLLIQYLLLFLNATYQSLSNRSSLWPVTTHKICHYLPEGSSAGTWSVFTDFYRFLFHD